MKLTLLFCAAMLLGAPAAMAQALDQDLYLDDYSSAYTGNSGTDTRQQVNLNSDFGSGNSNVQVNIDNTRVIDSSRNVNVSHDVQISHSVNGVDNSYGLGGASVLGTITAKSDATAYLNGQRHAVGQAIGSAVLNALGLPNY